MATDPRPAIENDEAGPVFRSSGPFCARSAAWKERFGDAWFAAPQGKGEALMASPFRYSPGRVGGGPVGLGPAGRPFAGGVRVGREVRPAACADPRPGDEQRPHRQRSARSGGVSRARDGSCGCCEVWLNAGLIEKVEVTPGGGREGGGWPASPRVGAASERADVSTPCGEVCGRCGEQSERTKWCGSRGFYARRGAEAQSSLLSGSFPRKRGPIAGFVPHSLLLQEGLAIGSEAPPRLRASASAQNPLLPMSRQRPRRGAEPPRLRASA